MITFKSKKQNASRLGILTLKLVEPSKSTYSFVKVLFLHKSFLQSNKCLFNNATPYYSGTKGREYFTAVKFFFFLFPRHSAWWENCLKAEWSEAGTDQLFTHFRHVKSSDRPVREIGHLINEPEYWFYVFRLLEEEIKLPDKSVSISLPFRTGG